MGDGDGPLAGTAGIAEAAAERPVLVDDAARRMSTTGTRNSEKERRLAERGDRILDALAALITRWGYGKTTVDDIAREAGVAKGTVYLHWPTKGAMLQALIEREEREWNAVVAERMMADPRNGSISSTYRHALALSMESPLLRALFTGDHDALGEWTRSPQVRARSHRRMEALHALIRAMRAAGLMRTDLSVEVQAYMITALSYGILTVDEFLPADLVPSREDVADAFAVMLRRGLEPELADDEEAAALARGQAIIADVMAGLADAEAPSNHATPQVNRSSASGNGRRSTNRGDKETNT
jgi:AcrR family transcriptional regulator